MARATPDASIRPPLQNMSEPCRRLIGCKALVVRGASEDAAIYFQHTLPRPLIELIQRRNTGKLQSGCNPTSACGQKRRPARSVLTVRIRYGSSGCLGLRADPRRYLCTPVEVQLGENVLDVRLGRALGNNETGRDVLVAHAVRDQLGHLQLPRGPGRVLPGRSPVRPACWPAPAPTVRTSRTGSG